MRRISDVTLKQVTENPYSVTTLELRLALEELKEFRRIAPMLRESLAAYKRVFVLNHQSIQVKDFRIAREKGNMALKLLDRMEDGTEA